MSDSVALGLDEGVSAGGRLSFTPLDRQQVASLVGELRARLGGSVYA